MQEPYGIDIVIPVGKIEAGIASETEKEGWDSTSW